jgi:hypothetical protein
VTLLLFAAAVWLLPGRRLKTLRGIGYGTIFAGLLILLLLRLGGGSIIDSLVDASLYKVAARHAFAIVVSLLKTSAWTLVVVGLIIAVGTWLAGAGERATRFRRAVAPALVQHPEAVWGTFALIVLLVLIWGPIHATRNLLSAAILVGLTALGLEAFRRQVVREFPDARFAGSAAFWGGIRSSLARSSTETGGSDPIDSLERLSALHDRGVLTDDEFSAQKAALLGG